MRPQWLMSSSLSVHEQPSMRNWIPASLTLENTHTHTYGWYVRGCEEGLHRCSIERRRPAAEGEVQVLQVLQGGEGSDASIRQPGALGGVDPVEAWGASAQSLPASIRQLVVPCESALMGEVHLHGTS